MDIHYFKKAILKLIEDSDRGKVLIGNIPYLLDLFGYEEVTNEAIKELIEARVIETEVPSDYEHHVFIMLKKDN